MTAVVHEAEINDTAKPSVFHYEGTRVQISVDPNGWTFSFDGRSAVFPRDRLVQGVDGSTRRTRFTSKWGILLCQEIPSEIAFPASSEIILIMQDING